MIDGTEAAFIDLFFLIRVFVQRPFIQVPAFIQGRFIPILALTQGRFIQVLAFIRGHFNSALGNRRVRVFSERRATRSP
jgi:hypothetical protein